MEKLDPTPRPLDQLVALPAFRSLLDGPLDEQLEAGVQAAAFATGEVIVREGSRVEGLHVVIAGAARLTVRGADGTDREVERIAVGNYFGEGAVLGGQASDVTVTADSDLRLVVVSPDALYRMLGKLPPLSRQLGDLIDVRRRAANAARRIRTTAQPAGT
jgi:CRP-like cAMP-binding protein